MVPKFSDGRNALLSLLSFSFYPNHLDKFHSYTNVTTALPLSPVSIHTNYADYTLHYVLTYIVDVLDLYRNRNPQELSNISCLFSTRRVVIHIII